jgi:two-component system response regulator HydG
MSNRHRILVVDDETIAVENLAHVFARAGHEVATATSGDAALELLGESVFDVMLTDLRMPGMDGMTLLAQARQLCPDLEVVVVTAFASPHSAVEAMRAGAFYYVEKPFRLDEVRKVVGEALEKVRLKRENRMLRARIASQQAGIPLVSEDPEVLALMETAKRIAASDCAVMVEGETGTGKEVVARLVHDASPRRDAPFVAINCGAFSEELLANELFGHERGAFTGAGADKPGLFEAANGGTLFLDEITEMPLPMQVKLLRVLQEKEVLRLGATKPRPIDVRFVSATNRTIDKEVQEGRFRQDLYYRLNVVSLHLPPLSARRGDIPLLAMHFLRRYSRSMGREILGFSAAALDALQRHSFPGNIRELENIVERGVAITQSASIELGDLPAQLANPSSSFDPYDPLDICPLEEMEQRYITWVLGECKGNQQLAAKRLGIDRSTLWRKLKRQGAPDPAS